MIPAYRAPVYAGSMNAPAQSLSLPAPASGHILLLVSPSATLPALFEMVARLAQHGELFVLDGGNIFQGYGLAAALRRQHADVAQCLQHVMLSRTFTCYQVAALLEEDQLAGKPVLALDFLSTFYDQDIRIAERRRLLLHCIRRLQMLARTMPVAVWVRQRSVVPEESLAFLEILQRAAGRVWYPPRAPALPGVRQPALF